MNNQELEQRVRGLQKRLRALERQQRRMYFIQKVWQRTVDELTEEFFGHDPEKTLTFGAKVARYTDELREIMGYDGFALDEEA